jgi:hypothetical protein
MIVEKPARVPLYTPQVLSALHWDSARTSEIIRLLLFYIRSIMPNILGKICTKLAKLLPE